MSCSQKMYPAKLLAQGRILGTADKESLRCSRFIKAIKKEKKRKKEKTTQKKKSVKGFLVVLVGPWSKEQISSGLWVWAVLTKLLLVLVRIWVPGWGCSSNSQVLPPGFLSRGALYWEDKRVAFSCQPWWTGGQNCPVVMRQHFNPGLQTESRGSRC